MNYLIRYQIFSFSLPFPSDYFLTTYPIGLVEAGVQVMDDDSRELSDILMVDDLTIVHERFE